jgi:hypothetical protein
MNRIGAKKILLQRSRDTEGQRGDLMQSGKDAKEQRRAGFTAEVIGLLVNYG